MKQFIKIRQTIQTIAKVYFLDRCIFVMNKKIWELPNWFIYTNQIAVLKPFFIKQNKKQYIDTWTAITISLSRSKRSRSWSSASFDFKCSSNRRWSISIFTNSSSRLEISFSLSFNSSKMHSISPFHFSWRERNESAAVRGKSDFAIFSSASRISGNLGLSCGSGLKQSKNRKEMY